MRKTVLIFASLLALTSAAFCGDLWRVRDGAYASSDWNALVRLYNLPHRTNAYRDYRDYLINQGVLTPVRGTVEVVRYLDGAAELLGRDGNTYYLPREDFAYQLGSA